MRRILSLVLLAAFGLPAVAPALTLGQETDASLPACCRRNGAHHCTMKMHRPPSSAPAYSQRCPSFPQPSTAPVQLTGFALLSAPLLAVEQQTSQPVLKPSPALRSSTHDFALYKRGPPSHLL